MTHAQTSEKKYQGSIKLAGMPPFDFNTKATSIAKARNNGRAQYARRLNMSIARFNAELKKTPHTINVRDDEVI